jgi:signal transduction histidine kinase
MEEKNTANHQFGGLLAWVLEHGEPVLVNDLAADPRSSGVPEGHLPIRRLLCMPVIKGKEILGQIAVAEAPREYGRWDLTALERLAKVFASVVANQRRKEQAARLETQIQQAQKMEAIGAMADGIANDFNNLLQSVNGYAEILLLEKTEGDFGYAELTEIMRASSRATALIRQLLAFSRRFETNLRPVDLNQLVRQLKKNSFRLIPEAAGGPRNLDIEIDLADELEKINADPVQMEQVLANLLVNAVENCQDGSRISIATANVTLDQEFCSLHLGAKPGDHVQLVFSDNGRGMDRATRKRIFEPFFTTKPAGKGSGMGLAMVYGIVKSHDGYITCDSSLGMGATFHIYLPALKTSAAVWDDTERKSPNGHETVLVVDDEEGIRQPTAQLLEAHGYHTMTAASGESALELFRENPDGIELVLLDLAMPGMGGAKCLREMLVLKPEAKVIIVSGYLANTQVKESLDAGAKAMIAKPFQMSTLLRQVRAVLDS